MVDIRRFLHLLRPAGAPGAAAGAAVPINRRAALEAELTPVFAALAGVEADCLRIRSEAEAQAARRATEAAAFAADTVAAAEEEAPIRRAEAIEGRLAQARRDSYRSVAAAESEADGIAHRAAPVISALAAAAVDAVRRHGEGR